LPECFPWDQKCNVKAQCDNCSQRSAFQSEGLRFVEHKEHGSIVLNTSNLDITPFIKKLLLNYEQDENISLRCDGGRAWSNKSDEERLNLGEKIWQDCFKRMAGDSEVSGVLGFGSQSTCLSHEIYRLLARFGIIKPGRSISILPTFSEGNFRVLVKNFTDIIAMQDKSNMMSKVMDLEVVSTSPPSFHW